MSSSLDIGDEMRGFDRKDRLYYDNFAEEDRKKHSTYLMLRWGASVSGSADMQAYYLMATNENINRNFFDIAKYPALQWLSCTTVSPAMGNQKHYWLGAKKKDSSNSKVEKFLSTIYPNKKQDEIELLAKLNDKNTIMELARLAGHSDAEIKKEFK